MTHVVISYKHEDEAFAVEVENLLKAAGFDVWRDDKIPSGEKWFTEIEIKLRDSYAVVLIATQKTIKSEWVNFEWAFALGTGAKVIAIHFEENVLIPEPLATIQHISFQERLDSNRLISDLQEWKNKSWMKYWIPTNTSTIVRCALEGLMATDDTEELDSFVKILMKGPKRKSSATALIKALESTNWNIRAKAAWALGPIHDETAVKPLIAILSDVNEHRTVRAHAAGALGDMRDKSAVTELVKLMNSKDGRIVFSSLTRQVYRQDTLANQAMQALNLIGTDEALAAVERWKREQGGQT